MDYFDAMIAEMLDKTQIVGAILPGFYGKIKEAIETSYKGKPIISLSEFHQYCNSMLEEPINEEQCKYLTSYLKQIGIILWNQKNPEVVYINKKWIIRNIYKVLEELSVKKGEFDLQHVIQSIEGIHKEKDAADLIQIMLDFTMIFQHPYCNKYIAPLYLPTIPDELINMFVDKNARAYRRIKYSGFIHKHIILSFFHKYSKLIWGNTEVNKSSYYYWKDAIIIKDPATSEIVMIQFHLGGNDGNASIDITKLNIYVPTSFADDIVKYLHEINTGYETEEMVTGNGTNYVPLSVIYENEEKENYTFLYNNKYYKLGDFKQYLKKTNQMKKIFISYSKQDLTIVNRFTDHLAALRQDGKIAHWYCSELLAGSEWDAEIKRHFDEADIICFMISHNFMRTQYIHEHEIARAFERKNENSNLKIIPIILDFCRWTTEKNNLGNFTALPYTAKPVADFQNENMAWYIIEECLRLIIDQDIKDTDQSLYTNAGLPMDIRKIYERMTDGSVDKNSK